MDVIEELAQELEDMDRTHEDYEELSHTLDVCRDFSYLLEEGFISTEETEDGEILLFPEADAVELEIPA